MDSVTLNGCQMYFDYFRIHERLAVKTPADIAGIKISSANKRVGVVQDASI